MTEKAEQAEPGSEADDGSLQGRDFDLTKPEQVRQAIDLACDYRGDVTIHAVDGRRLEGYVFDKRHDIAEPYLRLMLADTGERVTVRYAEMTRLQFTGRDTAAGKSWETWVKKYQEKKAKGEAANIMPDSLD